MQFQEALDNVNFQDSELIHEITIRVKKMFPALDYDSTDMDMDLIAVHGSLGLRLIEMLEGDSLNLMHDIFGIAHNLNRETLELENFFSPRYGNQSQENEAKLLGLSISRSQSSERKSQDA